MPIVVILSPDLYARLVGEGSSLGLSNNSSGIYASAYGVFINIYFPSFNNGFDIIVPPF
jgi:hypothetical protein